MKKYYQTVQKASQFHAKGAFWRRECTLTYSTEPKIRLAEPTVRKADCKGEEPPHRSPSKRRGVTIRCLMRSLTQ